MTFVSPVYTVEQTPLHIICTCVGRKMITAVKGAVPDVAMDILSASPLSPPPFISSPSLHLGKGNKFLLLELLCPDLKFS